MVASSITRFDDKTHIVWWVIGFSAIIIMHVKVVNCILIQQNIRLILLFCCQNILSCHIWDSIIANTILFSCRSLLLIAFLNVQLLLRVVCKIEWIVWDSRSWGYTAAFRPMGTITLILLRVGASAITVFVLLLGNSGLGVDWEGHLSV